jgi:hypothetical protein
MGGLYVQIGAGFSNPPGWRNYDASPTLRLQRLPGVGRVASGLSGNAAQFPDGILFGDVVKGLPHAPGSVDGIYASHVLEHLSLVDMRTALQNCFALLRPGGIFRLIVPDLRHRAEDYVAAAETGDANAAHRFMRSTMLGLERRPTRLLGRLRALLGNSAHLWMWDTAAIRHELEKAGFVEVRNAQFGDSADPMFDAVEDETRFVERGRHEVAMQAAKPSGT